MDRDGEYAEQERHPGQDLDFVNALLQGHARAAPGESTGLPHAAQRGPGGGTARKRRRQGRRRDRRRASETAGAAGSEAPQAPPEPQRQLPAAFQAISLHLHNNPAEPQSQGPAEAPEAADAAAAEGEQAIPSAKRRRGRAGVGSGLRLANLHQASEGRATSPSSPSRHRSLSPWRRVPGPIEGPPGGPGGAAQSGPAQGPFPQPKRRRVSPGDGGQSRAQEVRAGHKAWEESGFLAGSRAEAGRAPPATPGTIQQGLAAAARKAPRGESAAHKATAELRGGRKRHRRQEAGLWDFAPEVTRWLQRELKESGASREGRAEQNSWQATQSDSDTTSPPFRRPLTGARLVALCGLSVNVWLGEPEEPSASPRGDHHAQTLTTSSAPGILENLAKLELLEYAGTGAAYRRLVNRFSRQTLQSAWEDLCHSVCLEQQQGFWKTGIRGVGLGPTWELRHPGLYPGCRAPRWLIRTGLSPAGLVALSALLPRLPSLTAVWITTAAVHSFDTAALFAALDLLARALPRCKHLLHATLVVQPTVGEADAAVRAQQEQHVRTFYRSLMGGLQRASLLKEIALALPRHLSPSQVAPPRGLAASLRELPVTLRTAVLSCAHPRMAARGRAAGRKGQTGFAELPQGVQEAILDCCVPLLAPSITFPEYDQMGQMLALISGYCSVNRRKSTTCPAYLPLLDSTMPAGAKGFLAAALPQSPTHA